MTLPAPVSSFRQRLIEDMDLRRLSSETQRNYLRDVGRFASFLGRSPDTATPEEVRRFQIEQQEAGVPVPTMNSIVSALRFFFTHTLDRPDLARKLVRVGHPRKIPVVLSMEEVARLLDATTCLKLWISVETRIPRFGPKMLKMLRKNWSARVPIGADQNPRCRYNSQT
jgi:integrase/recombinase XerD